MKPRRRWFLVPACCTLLGAILVSSSHAQAPAPPGGSQPASWPASLLAPGDALQALLDTGLVTERLSEAVQRTDAELLAMAKDAPRDSIPPDEQIFFRLGIYRAMAAFDAGLRPGTAELASEVGLAFSGGTEGLPAAMHGMWSALGAIGGAEAAAEVLSRLQHLAGSHGLRPDQRVAAVEAFDPLLLDLAQRTGGERIAEHLACGSWTYAWLVASTMGRTDLLDPASAAGILASRFAEVPGVAEPREWTAAFAASLGGSTGTGTDPARARAAVIRLAGRWAGWQR